MKERCITLLVILFSLTATVSGTGKTGKETYLPSPEEKAVWEQLLKQGIEKIVFVKRFTYNSNHYYTEYLNSQWMPGGNL
ncbi:MAG: hypothetical protein LBQ39_11105, partial [Tannerellaceae bacterium]|nr:hypothetical protein [Tannerellaceae bacterium]